MGEIDMDKIERLRKEVAALKGAEIIYQFTEINSYIIDGEETPAYVAQADFDKGITIMGPIPEDFCDRFNINPNEDVILQCCHSSGNPFSEKYIEVVEGYINKINTGVFKNTNQYMSGRDNLGMREVCPFT
jgi:hypothetical protein